ncbi:MAG: hypothetical protein RBG13Loki_3369 [Promethearchaeota archaeon CR_4]|nr:MAG: hypothetical protein RBG13Loki_3369 [Candidatus Lokiarchaeota archaeon CR_4]
MSKILYLDVLFKRNFIALQSNLIVVAKKEIREDHL